MPTLRSFKSNQKPITTMKTLLFFFALHVASVEAFAPLSTSSRRSSLSSIYAKTEAQPKDFVALDQAPTFDARLSQSISKHLEDEDKDVLSTRTFCLPLEKISLDDLPKVGGYVGKYNDCFGRGFALAAWHFTFLARELNTLFLVVNRKTASLGEMIQQLAPLGVDVPGGFGVTSWAYDALLDQNDLRERLTTLLADVDGEF